MKQSTFIVQFNTQGKVLLLKRPADHKKYPNQWTLPGGKVDAGETTEMCAHREMLEETGIQMYSFEQVPVFLGGESSVVYSYLALNEWDGDEILKAFPNREHVEYGWFDILDLPEDTSILATELLLLIEDRAAMGAMN